MRLLGLGDIPYCSQINQVKTKVYQRKQKHFYSTAATIIKNYGTFLSLYLTGAHFGLQIFHELRKLIFCYKSYGTENYRMV